MRRNQIIMGVGLLVIVLIVLAIWFRSPSPRPRPFPDSLPQLQEPRPIYDWYVCEELGVGAIPGVPEPRLRFRVCHNDGWELLAYCLQPNWPAPEVGSACALIDDNTFWCGEGLQNLREYAILQTPIPTTTPTLAQTETPTPTASVTPVTPTQTPGTPLATATATPVAGTTTPTAPIATPATPTATQPTAIATQRPSPGGYGYLDWLVSLFTPPRSTPTPFQPLPPTPTFVEAQPTGVNASDPADEATGFNGIDFSNPWERIRIKIYPPNWQINSGKPIVIAFNPGQTCQFGDRQACINTFTAKQGGETTFVTVHSGVNGEAEPFRRAVEGFDFDQAGFPLRKIQARLRDLQGADVEIVQGDTVVSGLMLSVAVRVPPKFMDDYLNAALPDALSMAAAINPSMNDSLAPAEPQVVFETCGWKMPWEPWLPGMTSTNASIYLGVIQKRP